MTDLFLLLIVLFIGMFFWRQRQQTEYVQKVIEHRCHLLGLQVLSVSRGAYRTKDHEGHIGLFSLYHFEFSADGADAYQGYAIVKGHQVRHFYLPPHHIPTGFQE